MESRSSEAPEHYRGLPGEEDRFLEDLKNKDHK